MTDITPIHESKKHGTDNFAYSIYHSVIPINMVRYPLHWHDEVEIYYFRYFSIQVFWLTRRLIPE